MSRAHGRGPSIDNDVEAVMREVSVQTFVTLDGVMQAPADEVASAGFELVASSVSTTGVLMTRYRKKGPVEIGSFALEAQAES